MYESKGTECRNAFAAEVAVWVWISKILLYENPYSVTGTIKLTGLYQQPKDICKDSDNGTREACNVENLLSMKRWIGKH